MSFDKQALLFLENLYVHTYFARLQKISSYHSEINPWYINKYKPWQMQYENTEYMLYVEYSVVHWLKLSFDK